ncbi:MAG: methylmalonyl-CoA mutase family protein [Chitinophagales bacterium]
MPLDTYESTFQQFSETTSEDWKNKIIKDLKGEAFDKLIWHTKEGIEILPFYTKADNKKYQLTIPAKQTTSWIITEKIIVDNFEEANKQALSALEYGAERIVFDLQHKVPDKGEVEMLLKGILLDVAPVCFENYKEENKTLLESFAKKSCVQIIKIQQQTTITDELVEALQQALRNETFDLHVHFYIGQNYFFDIAKLRAFRWLWKQVCDLKNQPYHIFIQCETSVNNFSKEYEYSNILRNTTSAMSAVLGGCDSLIINSHDAGKKNTEFGKRIARNINHILQHESYFNSPEVSENDAAKGSYYIEYLTYQLCKKSWEKFSKL